MSKCSKLKRAEQRAWRQKEVQFILARFKEGFGPAKITGLCRKEWGCKGFLSVFAIRHVLETYSGGGHIKVRQDHSTPRQSTVKKKSSISRKVNVRTEWAMSHLRPRIEGESHRGGEVLNANQSTNKHVLQDPRYSQPVTPSAGLDTKHESFVRALSPIPSALFEFRGRVEPTGASPAHLQTMASTSRAGPEDTFYEYVLSVLVSLVF
jgi:hypothetical protein